MLNDRIVDIFMEQIFYEKNDKNIYLKKKIQTTFDRKSLFAQNIYFDLLNIFKIMNFH